MKRPFILLFVLLLLRCHSFAQCTPNDSVEGKLLYPDELPYARAGHEYSQTLSIRVPKDTSAEFGGQKIDAVIDSLQLLYIAGKPPGYEDTCNTPNCVWLGGTKGCVLLYGKSDSAGSAVGEYPIKIYIRIWFTASGTQISRIDSITNYKFRVLPLTGLREAMAVEPLKIFPNPSSDGTFKIEMHDLRSERNYLTVSDIAGRTVYEKELPKPDQLTYTETIQLENGVKGIFLITLKSGDRIIRGKIMLH